MHGCPRLSNGGGPPIPPWLKREIWDAGWQFDDPPESDLLFQRTGREMVFYGEIEEADDIPVYVIK